MAGIFLFLLVCYVYHIKFVDGLADLPVAFMVFLALYCLIIANQKTNNKETYAFLIMGMLVACGAAITKQAGIYLLVVFPFLSIFLY